MTITTEALLLARNALTDAMRAAHNNVMWRPDQAKATEAVLAIGAALAAQPVADPALHTAVRLVLDATPDQLPMALDALRDHFPDAGQMVAQPVADAVPVAWGVFAMMDGTWSMQWPPRMTEQGARADLGMYRPGSVLEVRPLYAGAAPVAREADPSALERARNAGFVEASRILGAEIERLRAAAAHPQQPSPGELQAVRNAVLGYYSALDRRQHGGVAQDAAFRAIEQALGMHWVQGASLSATPAPTAAPADQSHPQR